VDIADRGEHNAAKQVGTPKCRAFAGISVGRDSESTAPSSGAHLLQRRADNCRLPATVLHTTDFAGAVPARSPPGRTGLVSHTRFRVRQMSAP
jgi:hypothetical protein